MQRVESVAFALVDQTGAQVGTLEPSDPGSVTATEGRRVLRGLDLLPSDWAALDPYQDFVVVTYTVDGTTSDVGTFAVVSGVGVQFAGVEQSGAVNAGYRGTVDLVDLSAFLDVPIPVPYTVNVGAIPSNAIEDLLELAGFPNHAVDYLPTPIGEPATFDGTFLQAIDALTDAGGAYPLFFDGTTPTVETAPDPASMTADHTYDVGDGLVVGRPSYPFDAFAYNRWYALGGTDAAALVGVYQLASGVPGSQGQRGFPIVNRFEPRGVTTAAGLNAAARTQAMLDFRAANTLSFETLAVPTHGAFDVISNAGRLWLETSWTLSLTPGNPMRHQCGAVLVP